MDYLPVSYNCNYLYNCCDCGGEECGCNGCFSVMPVRTAKTMKLARILQTRIVFICQA